MQMVPRPRPDVEMPHASVQQLGGEYTALLRHVTGFPRRGLLRELGGPANFSDANVISRAQVRRASLDHTCLDETEPAREVRGRDISHFLPRADGRTRDMVMVAAVVLSAIARPYGVYNHLPP